MPSDVTPQIAGEGETIERQRIRALIAALEDKMPEGFAFNFGVDFRYDGCRTVGCAMGLARLLWPEFDELCSVLGHASASMQWFGMRGEVVDDIFYSRCGAYGADDAIVAPGAVAAMLRRFVDDHDAYCREFHHRHESWIP